MKPFRLIIEVDSEGNSQLKIDSSNKKKITQGQIVQTLAGILEKVELGVAIDELHQRLIADAKKEMQGIQIVKDLPSKMKKGN